MKSLTVLFLLAAPLFADGVTGGTVNTLLALTPGFGARPAVATNPLGRSIVAWVAFQGAPGNQTLNVAFLDASGNVAVAPAVISVGTLLPGLVEVAATPAGFLLTFDAVAALGQFERNVYYRFYDLAGTQVAAGQANTISALSAEAPRCAGNANGDYAVVWVRRNVFASFPNAQEVWVRRFDSLGNPVDATEVRVDDPAVGFGGMGGTSVGLWPSGRLVVTWQDGTNGTTPGPASPDGHGQGVYARWFDATLTPTTAPIVANTTTAFDQFEPLVRCDDRNRCLIGWCGDSSAVLVDAWVRAFDDQGTALDAADQNLTPMNTASDQFLQSVSGTSNGEWVATWVDSLSTLGEPAPRGGWARLAQNRSLIETGTTSSGGSANQGFMFPRAGCDQWGNFILVWQVQTPATGGATTMGIDYRRFARNMITVTPPIPPPARASPSRWTVPATPTTSTFSSRPRERALSASTRGTRSSRRMRSSTTWSPEGATTAESSPTSSACSAPGEPPPPPRFSCPRFPP